MGEVYQLSGKYYQHCNKWNFENVRGLLWKKENHFAIYTCQKGTNLNFANSFTEHLCHICVRMCVYIIVGVLSCVCVFNFFLQGKSIRYDYFQLIKD